MPITRCTYSVSSSSCAGLLAAVLAWCFSRAATARWTVLRSRPALDDDERALVPETGAALAAFVGFLAAGVDFELRDLLDLRGVAALVPAMMVY